MVSTPTINGIGKQVLIIIVIIIIIKLLLRHILMAKFAPRVTKHMRGLRSHHIIILHTSTALLLSVKKETLLCGHSLSADVLWGSFVTHIEMNA